MRKEQHAGDGSAAGGKPGSWGGAFTLHPSLFALLFLLAGCQLPGGAPIEDSSVPVGIEVGQRAPPLVGTMSGGARFQLAPDRRARATLLVFYRGIHCGLCRERLRELEAYRSVYDQAGARIFAVTLDPPAEAGRTPELLSLGFPVVRVDSATFAEWQLLDSDRSLPLPAAVVLDRRGVIRYRHVGRNAADRASDIELLAAIQAVLAE